MLATLVGAGDDATSFIVLDLRLPRALTAVLAGAALGIAGAIFQDLARNPLVAPGHHRHQRRRIARRVALIVFGDVTARCRCRSRRSAGALVAGAALYGLAWRGGVQGYRLVLVGIGVAALLQAGDLLRAHARADLRGRARLRLARRLAERPRLGARLAARRHAGRAAPARARARPPARGAPARRRRRPRARASASSARASRCSPSRSCSPASPSSAAGPIAFVAFIAPHIARRICATVSPSGILPVAAAAGALLVLSADLAGRLLFAPDRVPVGIVTSIIAAPYFLFLLRRANRLGVTG